MKNLARAFTFQNHRFRSGGDQSKLQPPRLSDAYKNRAHSNVAAQNRGFSGPLTALVPIEVRASNNNKNRKEKERGREDGGGGFDSDVEEPRSPKVSCMGQIKQRKKLHKLKREKSKKMQKLETIKPEEGAKKNPNSGIGNIFRRKSKSFASAAITEEKTVSNPPPGLSQMKRFSSGRDALSNFDWTKQQVAPVDRECYSDDDEQRRDYWDDDDDDEDDEFGVGGGRNDVMIPFSAPMMIGGGDIQLQPRKEICLWKKRNMQPPKPLKLTTFR